LSDTDLHGSDITRYEEVEAEESGTQWPDVPFVSRYTAVSDAVKEAGSEGALSTGFSIASEVKGLGEDVMGVSPIRSARSSAPGSPSFSTSCSPLTNCS
jgi:hypothetical protein